MLIKPAVIGKSQKLVLNNTNATILNSNATNLNLTSNSTIDVSKLPNAFNNTPGVYMPLGTSLGSYDPLIFSQVIIKAQPCPELAAIYRNKQNLPGNPF